MSEPRWTPAQRAAIDDRGGALLVSAAAGSGKTAVLTERAVRLITDPEHPVDADRLLIVTFTNAAAAELRARIGQALLRRCQQEPGNTALRRQRMLLQRAPICTMDAFCLDLLHKHFQALDIPPDFAPADPGSVELLRTAALAETLEHAYADPDFCAFADLYGKGRTDKPAGDTILQVYDFLRALPDYDRKLDEFLAPWQQENGFDATCWHDLLLAQAARDAKAARELLCAAQQDCREDYAQEMAEAGEKKTPAAIRKAEAAVAEKYADAQGRLERSAALLGEVERLAQAGEWTPLYDRLTPFVLGMEEQPGLKGMKKRLKGDHKTAIKTRADEAADLFAQITEFISCSEEEAEADRQAALPGGAARPRPPEGAAGQNALLALDANFRSAPQVVEGINFIFEQLMTPQLGDTAYGDGQRLVCGAPGDYPGSVEAQFLPDDEAETDAAWIARRIEELVAAGEPVREGSTTRPVQYEDCCILLSARGDFPAYVEALTARGIPVYADARENLMEAPHIRPLISLLKVIDNPAQDIYLAAAMLGPVFGFTDDDLVRLRAQSAALQKEQNAGNAGKPARMSLYGALLLARQGPAV